MAAHFRSADIWQSASAADEVITTGWLGRHFDKLYPGFPEGYPTAAAPDPIAISMGYSSSETCQGLVSNFSLAVHDPRYTINVLETGDATPPDTNYGRELTFLRRAAAQTNVYGDIVKTKVSNGRNMAVYPQDNYLASQLRWIARMIDGGLETKVYVATIDGFDTHADQVEVGDPLSGEHSYLLDQLAQAVAVFQADIQALGHGQRVLGMTYSEFGRRIRSNAAYGTDHGAAAPQFLFGECVRPQVLGQNPVIDRAVDEQESLPLQYDFRDVYGTVMEDWFGVSPSTVQEVLYAGYTKLPLLRVCGLVDAEEMPPQIVEFALRQKPIRRSH